VIDTALSDADREYLYSDGPDLDGLPRLRLISWSEMTAGPLEPVRYDWQGWVGLATVAIIAGTGESLKSWLALYLALMRASGRPPFDATEAPPAGEVLYFTAENGLAEEKKRCGLLKAGLDLPDDLPLTFIPAEDLCLGDEAHYAQVEALVASRKPVCIFVDSAIAVSGITNENDNAEVRRFIRARVAPLARKYGSTVYVIAHSPKPSMQPGARFTDEHATRGAGDWRNAVDATLYLRKDATLGELAVVVRHTKSRNFPRHTPMWFTLEDLIPGQSARLVYGGIYHDETGQGEAAGLLRTVMASIEALKASPGGIYVKGLLDQLVTGGTSKASARRALDVLRGKKPWPGGPLRGKTKPVVAEDRHGKSVFLTFLAEQWPARERDDDD
jgi:hypothetical protein